jgi:hypothetical protein
MDQEPISKSTKSSIVWVGGRYGSVCRDCIRKGTPECLPECQPPDFKLFKPWYKR